MTPRPKAVRMKIGRKTWGARAYEIYKDGGWGHLGSETMQSVSMCARDFHRLFPHLRMKKGQGEVEILVDIRLVKPRKRKAAQKWARAQTAAAG